MEVRWRCSIIGMADKVGSEDSGGLARCQRCGTTGMDTAADEMWDNGDGKMGWNDSDGLGKY